MSVSPENLGTACDWLLAGLVGVVVVVEGSIATAFLPGPALVVPADYGTVRLALFGAALAAVAAGTVGAFLRSPAHAGLGLVGLAVAVVYGVTGLLLPWNQLSYWIGSTLLGVVVAVPLLGDPLARLLFGGVALNQGTLTRAFAVHYGVVALAAVGLAGAIARAVVRR